MSLTSKLRLIFLPPRIPWPFLSTERMRLSTHSSTFASDKQITNKNDEVDPNKPLNFQNSPAQKWKAEYSRRGSSNTEPRLWYEAPVVSLSIAIFLLYFCAYREENDIDQELGRTLYSRIDGLEELQLRISYKYNIENGLDVKDIERRMKELNMKNKE